MKQTTGHRTPLKKGDIVHLDTDNRDWGRVATDATVVENLPGKKVLVDAQSIRARIVVPAQDIVAKSKPTHDPKMNNIWCACGNPSTETDYYSDGESKTCFKHHWTCRDCGKILQIG